jgi:seryl-tRNA synthetase
VLDLKTIRSETDRVREAIRWKKSPADLDRLLELDESRRAVLTRVEAMKHRRNDASEEIGRRKRSGEDASAAIAEMKAVGDEIQGLDQEVARLEAEIESIQIWIPNVPHESVPRAEDASGNVIVSTVGEAKPLPFPAKPHWELAESLGLIDFARGAKIAGSGFLLFTGRGARLERGLMHFMLDLHTKKHGYVEVWPPHVVRSSSLFGTGQLPKLEGDMYRIQDEDLWLNPTAEVPVTNIYRDEILEGDKLPIYHTAYCPSYRREAGAAGRDTRGTIRVHQFDKVELVKFVRPETSYDELERLRADAEAVLRALELPYRIALLAAGDLSFAAAKCYDLEVWAPGEDRWLEVSSCSNFEDFQARRAGIRFRPAKGAKPEFVHTLNASGVALSRSLAALLEIHQTERGTVRIPEALVPYVDGMREILPD